MTRSLRQDLALAAVYTLTVVLLTAAGLIVLARRDRDPERQAVPVAGDLTVYLHRPCDVLPEPQARAHTLAVPGRVDPGAAGVCRWSGPTTLLLRVVAGAGVLPEHDPSQVLVAPTTRLDVVGQPAVAAPSRQDPLSCRLWVATGPDQGAVLDVTVPVGHRSTACALAGDIAIDLVAMSRAASHDG